MTFIASKLNLNGNASHKENLNNPCELNEWMANAYGKFASVIITASNGNTVTYTDNGQEFVVISKTSA